MEDYLNIGRSLPDHQLYFIRCLILAVKQWLEANPNEGRCFSYPSNVIFTSFPVLSLLIVNIDNLPAAQYGAVFSAVGLDTMSYSPTTLPLPASGWPTLGSLIDSGTRLITFMDNTADPTTVPYIIDGKLGLHGESFHSDFSNRVLKRLGDRIRCHRYYF